MKCLLLAPLIFGLASPVNAGIYFYPAYQDGIEVRCKDGKPSHLVEINEAGRGIKLEGHGEEQYSWPITYLYPEALDDKYRYFPSTAGTSCSYRKLNVEEKNSLILKAFKTCVGTDGGNKTMLEKRKKYCYGWN
ncbi:hypothetical protein [Prochlorococcus marinus]|uniref:Uncharacterized protein n=1 Tax=Prochlorococcus marinus XMU1408 TaxID=2213228 RepID=A0A318QXB5_PROMR|nr:hypothetical protein [Prochlorococcus marinus]MBW3042671.1 hypothetical protein [Prochlorococcus marinus str. XMU1408]PYE01366.1 hypothetical protein DNJ73_08120 [Prochlorococcus marinus XMU1408]